MKTIKAGILALGMFALATPAEAQMQWTDRGFVAVDGAIQSGSRDYNTSREFPLYEETARLTTEQRLKGGGLFDIRGGYRVWRNLAIGAGFSSLRTTGDISVQGKIPSPVVHDQLRDVSLAQAGATQAESALHLSGTWMVPVTDKVDVGITGGPSFFFVKQDTLTDLQVSEPGPTVVATLAEESETAVGFHVGLDVRYFITKSIGIGGLARYTFGEVTLSNGPIKVGGMQVGGGVRFRF